MPRKTVVDPQTDMRRAIAPQFIEAGIAELAAGTKQALVATSTPCAYVWVGAICSAAGAAVNTKPIWIGNTTAQVQPVVPADFKGYFFGIEDASDVYLIGTAGEKVNYIIYG